MNSTTSPLVRKQSTHSVSAVLHPLNTIKFSKTQIDPYIITPNKLYNVKCYEGYEKYNGRYILSSKQVVLTLQDGEYIPTTAITLRKVVS